MRAHAQHACEHARAHTLATAVRLVRIAAHLGWHPNLSWQLQQISVNGSAHSGHMVSAFSSHAVILAGVYSCSCGAAAAGCFRFFRACSSRWGTSSCSAASFAAARWSALAKATRNFFVPKHENHFENTFIFSEMLASVMRPSFFASQPTAVATISCTMAMQQGSAVPRNVAAAQVTVKRLKLPQVLYYYHTILGCEAFGSPNETQMIKSRGGLHSRGGGYSVGGLPLLKLRVSRDGVSRRESDRPMCDERKMCHVSPSVCGFSAPRAAGCIQVHIPLSHTSHTIPLQVYSKITKYRSATGKSGTLDLTASNTKAAPSCFVTEHSMRAGGIPYSSGTIQIGSEPREVHTNQSWTSGGA